MNKENRGAAGLRRSAIAERIRLQKEWSALKEVDDTPTTSAPKVLKKKPVNSRCTPGATGGRQKHVTKKAISQPIQVCSDALAGVVALVDVGSEDKALPLRAVLTALGATVVKEWSPLVTHLIWTDSGTRCVRARARALACKLVSPLWVEACAAAARRLSERLFPAASRQSDLPSPKTMRMLLKRAERENIPLVNLLSDSKDEEEMPRLRLRVSSSDTSREKTTDVSNETIDYNSRINTGPRRIGTTGRSGRPPTTTRPAPLPPTTKPPKSRRKLFTCKEVQDLSTSGDDSDTGNRKNLQQNKLTQAEKRDLARAERMAKKLLAACNTENNNNNNNTATQQGLKPRIVLTGMTRHERQAITKCIEKLGGVIQNNVNKRTTHVLLGACKTVLSAPCSNHDVDITGVSAHCDYSKPECWPVSLEARARTLSALGGAARGCRVLVARWAVLCAQQGRWLPHHGFEVQHLRKISQKARVERAALGRLNSDYAYDVFSGMRVRVTEDAEQREAAKQLLKLCGAVVLDGRQNGGLLQDGRQHGDVDIVVGTRVGEVHSKWVFDSVAVARMRTTRRYLNMNSFSQMEKEHR